MVGFIHHDINNVAIHINVVTTYELTIISPCIPVVIDISVLVTGDRGPCSKYDITIEEGHFKGELELTWSGKPLKVHYFYIRSHTNIATCVHIHTCEYTHTIISYNLIPANEFYEHYGMCTHSSH